MENGLEITSREFKEFGKIHLMEFIDSDEKLLLIGSDPKDKKIKVIIWDLYNNHKVEPIPIEKEKLNFMKQNISTRLASTPGNLLQVDDEGNVTSILKIIDDITNPSQVDDKGKVKMIELKEEKNNNFNENNLTSTLDNTPLIKHEENH